jgi:hypothetical protein
MKKESNCVDVSIEYNAGCYDLLNGLRIWESETDTGRFLQQNGNLASLDRSEIDENYMSVIHVTYKLSNEDRAAYKFMFETELC